VHVEEVTKMLGYACLDFLNGVKRNNQVKLVLLICLSLWASLRPGGMTVHVVEKPNYSAISSFPLVMLTAGRS
jgi:hypothetical protein